MGDSVLRALTDDGGFRVVACDATETVRGAVAAQGVSGELARQFGELVTGSILVRESMSPDLRVQAILQGDDSRSRLVADAHPGGMTRGLVQLATGATTFTLSQRGLLQIARSLHNGAIQQGVVQVPESGGISGALMAYMQESEQVATVIAVGCHMDGETIVAAGGYLVQLLPELEEGPLMVMTERLNDFEAIEPMLARGAASPKALLEETLYGMPYSEVGGGELRFGCLCSAARLMASLATLPKKDISDLIADGKVLEIECDFCKHPYEFSPTELKGLLTPN